MTDAPLKNTLVPLVLRLALAAIFLYHGLTKVIGDKNTWGASWANHAWEQQSLPPKDVEEKLKDMKLDVDEAKNEEETEKVRGALRKAYQESAPTQPESIRYAAAQIAVAWGELLGGAALLLGVLTRLAALGLVVIQVGAILTVTAARGFSAAAGVGAEYNIALVAMCLVLILTGGGPCSVDGILRRRRQGPATA